MLGCSSRYKCTSGPVVSKEDALQIALSGKKITDPSKYRISIDQLGPYYYFYYSEKRDNKDSLFIGSEVIDLCGKILTEDDLRNSPYFECTSGPVVSKEDALRIALAKEKITDSSEYDVSIDRDEIAYYVRFNAKDNSGFRSVYVDPCGKVLGSSGPL
jgi:hypothetical protein